MPLLSIFFKNDSDISKNVTNNTGGSTTQINLNFTHTQEQGYVTSKNSKILKSIF